MIASSSNTASQVKSVGSGKPAVAICPAVPLISISLKLTAMMKSRVKIRRPVRTAAVAHPAPFASVVIAFSF